MPILAARPKVLASVKAAGKSRGETLYAVGAAIANAGINWAFKSWNDWSVEEAVCCSGVVRRPLGPPYHIAASLSEASVVCTPAEP